MEIRAYSVHPKKRRYVDSSWLKYKWATFWWEYSKISYKGKQSFKMRRVLGCARKLITTRAAAVRCQIGKAQAPFQWWQNIG